MSSFPSRYNALRLALTRDALGTEKGREKKEEIMFFYGKIATLEWDPDRWRWMDGGHFLDYTTKDGRDFIGNRNPCTTRAAENGKGIFRETIGSIGRKYETPFGPGKKPRSFGLFGIRQWQ